MLEWICNRVVYTGSLSAPSEVRLPNPQALGPPSVSHKTKNQVSAMWAIIGSSQSETHVPGQYVGICVKIG